MKKREQIELKIYEALGIRTFRKIAFGFRSLMFLPVTHKMTKEEKYDYFYKYASNYNLGSTPNYDSIKEHKKELYYNSLIHIVPLILSIPLFLKIVTGSSSLASIIILTGAVLLNGYCIMLQRYNCIRLNDLIRRMAPRYEKQKNKIKNELVKEHSILPEKEYKITDNKGRESNINFDELINRCSLEDLKYLRDYLKHFEYLFTREEDLNVNIYLMKQKKLQFNMNNKRTID